jgi:hypothetical protein
MKKILFTLSVAALAAPAFAVCPVTGGMCLPSATISRPSLQDEVVPNYLEEIRSPSVLRHDIQPSQNTKLLYPESGQFPTGGAAQTETGGYNANCQFGLCLPKSQY